jgi:histidinol-phosphatase (PHP family)
MRLDYHMHTVFSDGTGEMAEYIDKALKRKIDEIGFSDHIHLRREAWSMDPARLADYVNTIKKFSKTSLIPVKAGLEVEFVPGELENLMRVANRLDLDYLMGSVHHIGNWLIDSEKQVEEWKKRDVDQVYKQYFDLVQAMAKTRLFDIVGHLDLVKKFNFQPKSDLNDHLLETVKIIGKNGMCIEVNTGGLRKPCHEVYPSEKLLKMCFDNGLPITFGSDAHSPEDVGADFEKAAHLVKALGYDEIVRFTRRKRDLVKL